MRSPSPEKMHLNKRSQRLQESLSEMAGKSLSLFEISVQRMREVAVFLQMQKLPHITRETKHTPVKRKNKSPLANLTEMDIYELPDKESKAITLNRCSAP